MLQRICNARTCLALVMVCGLVMMSTAIMGCKAGPVRRNIDRVEAAVEKAMTAKISVDRYINAVASGELGIQAAIDALALTLPPDLANQVLSWKALGTAALDRLVSLSSALSDAGQAGMAELDKLRASLANAKDSDDATLQVITAITTLVTGAPIAGVIGAIFGVIRGRREGEVEGAKAVAGIVAHGRNVDPTLDAQFRSGPGHATMQTMLSQQPANIANAVRVAKTV